MPANLPMPKPPGVFSPWRKTSHFLLLMAALDLVIAVIIAILAPERTSNCGSGFLNACQPVYAVTAGRVLALFNINIGAIALYAGLISFLHKRPAAKLMALALLLFFISMFVAVRS